MLVVPHLRFTFLAGLTAVPTGTEQKMRAFGSGLNSPWCNPQTTHRSGPPLSGGVMLLRITSLRQLGMPYGSTMLLQKRDVKR